MLRTRYILGSRRYPSIRGWVTPRDGLDSLASTGNLTTISCQSIAQSLYSLSRYRLPDPVMLSVGTISIDGVVDILL